MLSSSYVMLSRVLECKQAVAAVLIAVELTEGRWKMQQELARLDIARL